MVLNCYTSINALSQATTGSFRSSCVALTSDSRLKQHIEKLSLGLNFVMALNPVSYEKKENLNSTLYKKHEIGFIAQEVQKILPQLVTESPDTGKSLLLITYLSFPF